LGTSAFAQATDEAAVDNNTIIVTAQRRSEALENVPMSVAVVTQETLNSLGVNSVRDLQNVTSGFLLNNSGSVPAAAIRGVTTTNGRCL
jgi:iron complex outermembrane receptor protein